MTGGSFDAVVIGSGFGASMIATKLVAKGRRVAMIERGDWVARSGGASPDETSLELTPHYSKMSPIKVLAGGLGDTIGSTACVGGPSVFYGAVSLRFRERDFLQDDEIDGDSGARWPFDYAELEPFYVEAESILDVSGADGDPTAPPRSRPYPQEPAPMAAAADRIRDAAETLGLRPFRLPLAINYRPGRRPLCEHFRNCDTFPCGVGAKNDLASTVIADLIAKGMALLPSTAVTKLLREGNRITHVECFNRATSTVSRIEADRFFLGAGALHSPHLLLASELGEVSSAGDLIGRHLMRHSSAIVYGVFARRTDPSRTFHKQVGIHDFYFGDRDAEAISGKLGSIQSIHPPPKGLAIAHLPKVVGPMLAPGVELMAGLLAMAEDQPRKENRLTIDAGVVDEMGLPRLCLEHHHTERDRLATKALVSRAKQILRKAGAIAFYVHPIKTFSHALGTVRMGVDEATSPLDRSCRFRGLDNLWVVDGSSLPRSSGVNPSLTIAANALRVGTEVA